MTEEQLTAAGYDNTENYTVNKIVKATSRLREASAVDRHILFEITGDKLRADDNFDSEDDG